MIRAKISGFIRDNKEKIKVLAKALVIVAMGVAFATIILSSLSKVNNENEKEKEEEKKNVYRPTQTIISGSDVSKEQYKEDSNLVNKFLDFCNNGNVEEAYALISDECKEEKYPTIERFKQLYYNSIFSEKKECNLQSWISNSKYTIYKVRYTNNMLSTGTYDEKGVYQDYITLKRNDDKEQISIGSFVDSEECNIVTKTDMIEATVVKKKMFLEEEEYEIVIKNNTDKTILLDPLETDLTIRLIGSNKEYLFDVNELFTSHLKIAPNVRIRLTISFNKSINFSRNSKYIWFLNVIKDYEAYKEQPNEYKDITNIKIKVED